MIFFYYFSSKFEKMRNKDYKGKQLPNGEPIKDPVQLTVTENTELMKFLLTNLRYKNRDNIKTYLRFKQVLVDGKIVTQYNHPLTPGQQVEILHNRIPAERQYRGISIIYEDQYLIVVDKHAGMLSIATVSEKEKTAYSMLSTHVKKQHPDNKIFVVHRLDRETSGLMIFAKSEKVQKLFQADWYNTVTERTYVAVTEGSVIESEGVITSYLKESKALIVYSSQNPAYGEKAVTHFTTLKINNSYSLLKINPETGRKNQIRVHMRDLGHSIVGDRKYGSTINPIGRLGLHAMVLSFVHPVSKEELHFETKIPQKFLKLFR
jgi:23S rRNA pseudouridine1911/1915/1917 synthase